MFSLCNSSTFLTIFFFLILFTSFRLSCLSFFESSFLEIFSILFIKFEIVFWCSILSIFLSHTLLVDFFSFLFCYECEQCFNMLLHSIVTCRNGKQERSPIWKEVSHKKNRLSFTNHLLHRYRCDVLVSLILFWFLYIVLKNIVPRMIPIWPQNDPRVTPTSSHSDPKMTWNDFRNDDVRYWDEMSWDNRADLAGWFSGRIESNLLRSIFQVWIENIRHFFKCLEKLGDYFKLCVTF